MRPGVAWRTPTIRRAPRSGASVRNRAARRARSLICGFVSRSDPTGPAGLRCRPGRRIMPCASGLLPSCFSWREALSSQR